MTNIPVDVMYDLDSHIITFITNLPQTDSEQWVLKGNRKVSEGKCRLHNSLMINHPCEPTICQDAWLELEMYRHADGSVLNVIPFSTICMPFTRRS